MALKLPRFRKGPAASNWSFDELRRQCMEGTEEAYKAFIDRFSPLVWRAVLSQLPHASREDQEEVVAGTFARLLSNRAEVLGRYNRALGLSPESYIRQQAVFQARNRRRSLDTLARRAEVPLESGESGSSEGVRSGDPPVFRVNHPDPAPDPERRLLDREEVEQLVVALEERLPPEVVLTFHLLYENGMTPGEVAQVLGCSTDTIYLRRKRIVATVGQILAEREAGRGRS